MGHSESSPKREIHSLSGLSKDTKNTTSNSLTLHIKELEKEQQIKPRVSRRKEIVKIRAKINHIETKQICKRSMNQKLVL